MLYLGNPEDPEVLEFLEVLVDLVFLVDLKGLHFKNISESAKLFLIKYLAGLEDLAGLKIVRFQKLLC